MNINDYRLEEQLQSISAENFSVYKRGDFERTQMSYVHNSSVLLMIEEGEAEYYIGKDKYHVKAGDIFVIGAGDCYMRRTTKVPYVRYGFSIIPRYYSCITDDAELLKVLKSPTVDNFERLYKNVKKEDFDELAKCLQQLSKERNCDYIYRDHVQRLLVMQIIILLYRAVGTEKTNNKEVDAAYGRVQEIKEYIHKHYAEEISLKKLSEEFFLHSTTISAEFSKYCNVTLNKYINSVRVKAAAKLLETQNYSVEVISVKVGYKNINTFIKQFKASTGMTPLEYKKSFKTQIKRVEVTEAIAN